MSDSAPSTAMDEVLARLRIEQRFDELIAWQDSRMGAWIVWGRVGTRNYESYIDIKRLSEASDPSAMVRETVLAILREVRPEDFGN